MNTPFALREYPLAFGRRVAGIIDKVKATARGQPELPEKVPAATETIQDVEWSTDPDLWCFVDFASAFNYLRQCKHLRIPSEWRGLIPHSL